MNVKIQGGGGGTYSNTGSCIAVTNYLEHENIEKLKNGQEKEHFFTHNRDKVSAKEVTYKIDNNKAKLCNKDSKFFVITVSPSQSEIKQMGATRAEQTKNFKEYINNGVMNRYAENFGKDLKAKDLMYYGKIHHSRDNKGGEQMHAHIIVSRKDLSNRIKLSPQTNHRKTGKNGTVKGGFDRENFYRKCEHTFDKGFNYNRDFKQSYDYCNTMKNGRLDEIKQLDKMKQQHIERQHQIREYHQEKEQVRKQSQSKSSGMRL